MAQSHDARLAELVTELGGDEVRFLFRDLVQKALQELIDAELTKAIGAARHERTETRTNQRNGARSRVLSTPAGDLEVAIPKLRKGSYFPSFLEPRRMAAQRPAAELVGRRETGVGVERRDVHAGRLARCGRVGAGASGHASVGLVGVRRVRGAAAAHAAGIRTV